MARRSFSRKNKLWSVMVDSGGFVNLTWICWLDLIVVRVLCAVSDKNENGRFFYSRQVAVLYIDCGLVHNSKYKMPPSSRHLISSFASCRVGRGKPTMQSRMSSIAHNTILSGRMSFFEIPVFAFTAL